MHRSAWILRLLIVVAAGSLLVTSTVVAIAPRLWGIANAHAEIPVALPDFAEIAQRSFVFDTAGNEIASYKVENSQPIAIADVPDTVKQAFLAVEDKEFYEHSGVNVRSLFRATLSNFASDGPVQGASTITMQVVKNDYMAGFERDGRYKVVQIAYAVRLEKQKTKDEILERYLNTVFFGENSYGISAAAETYFGKTVQELTFIEAAFLAGLVQAPASYDPIIRPQQSRRRFNTVLRRLEREGLITPEEKTQYAETFVLPVRVKKRPESTSERTYFSEALRDYLLNRTDILGDTYDERYTRLYRGGLQIHSTLDSKMQGFAEEARNVLPDNAAGIDAALTTLDVKTGAVRAMVGGRGFVPGTNEVNLALAPSQTGSAIKLFILSAALEAGATPNDLIDGTHPCKLPSGNPAEPIFEIKGGVSGGVATLQQQTAKSINCAYARLSQIVGLNRMVNTVYLMSGSPYLYRGQPPSEREPITPYGAFATGSNELSTLDMASGVQTIANEGVHMEPYMVESIDDSAGNRIYTRVNTGTEVLDRQVALTTISVLKTVLTSGTARQALAGYAKSRPAFGKTGTQDKNNTSMFAGSTPNLATAVLVRDPARYTSMAGIPEFVRDGVPKVQGGTYPARIWKAFNEQAGLDQFEFDWDPPNAPARPPARLFLPGNECVAQVVGYSTRSVVVPDAPAPATPAGLRAPTQGLPEQEAPAPPPTAPPAAPVTITQRVPITKLVPVGDTVPPNVLDPKATLPSLPANANVQPC